MTGITGYSQDPIKDIIKIGLLADIQYYNGPTVGSRHYRESLKKVPVAIQHFNNEDLNFIVDVGDRIDRDFESFDVIDKLLAKAHQPIVFVPGNHDYAVHPFLKRKVTLKTGYRKAYHARTLGNWRIIFLNGLDNSLIGHNILSLKYWKAKHYLNTLKTKKAPNAYDWNGGLGKKQTVWLTRQLEIAKRESLNIMVFCHQPITPGNAHNLWDFENILNKLSDQTGEIWWISGHDHRGGYEEINDVHLLILHGMVEGTEPSYGILEIRGNEVLLKGYGNQPGITSAR